MLSVSHTRAPRPPDDRQANAIVRVLTFDVGGRTCALPLQAVTEIVPYASLSCEPGSPSILGGFLNLAGAAIPVLRMFRLMEAPETVIGLSTPIIITKHGEERFGLLVDRVGHIAAVANTSMMALPPHALVESAVKIDEEIIPIVSIAQLVLEQEHSRIAELRGIHERRLVDLREAAA